MDQPAIRLPAGFGERGHGEMVHATIRLATALAQDANAIQHDVDAFKQVEPVRWPGQAFESSLPVSTATGEVGDAVFDTLRVSASDGDIAAGFEQRGDRVAPNESAAAEDHDTRGWNRIATDAHASTPGACVCNFCIDRNIRPN